VFDAPALQTGGFFGIQPIPNSSELLRAFERTRSRRPSCSPLCAPPPETITSTVADISDGEGDRPDRQLSCGGYINAGPLNEFSAELLPSAGLGWIAAIIRVLIDNLFKQCLIYLASARPIAIRSKGGASASISIFPGPVSNAITSSARAPAGIMVIIRNAPSSALLAPSTECRNNCKVEKTGLAVRLFHRLPCRWS